MMINILKFAGLAFTSLEYFTMAKEVMLEMEMKRLIKVFKIEECSRHLKKSQSKKMEAEYEKYVKAMDRWESMLTSFSKKFELDKDMSKIVDMSIDLLHRALDKMVVNDYGKPVEDAVKSHIFNSLDSIPPKDRTPEESLKIKAAFDNFLIINKLK